ncbi:unnamed protein product [Paramecium sonneborni]|uniref:Uncharacterized protein n=1 Tax=Paramecium sonneborni TaxID=65129 RepID=A0A8S1KVL5_9CILI|nr:unnamed protein product [Paramecium sonneborni]
MFGKTIKIQGSVLLKGKERENFETALRKQFNALTVKKIFEDSEQCMQEKLNGSKMIIYHTDEYPAFVDGTGKEDYVPSLFVVAEYPKLVGTLQLKDGVDEAGVLKAGKVLWNQICNQDKLGEFKKDSIKKLVNHQKKLLAIIAIGCDSVDLKKEQEKGIAGYILHKQGDKLWEHGPNELGQPIEPENFDEVQETKTQNYEEYSDEDIDLNMIAPGTKKPAVKKEQKKPSKAKPIQQQQQQQVKQQFADDSDEDNKHKKKGGKQEEKHQQQQQQQVGGVPTKVMDEYIKESFLNACKIGINDKQLPIEGQVFYEKYMLAFKKPGIELDLKNSSYQKIGKFLQTMQKDGLIEYKEIKKGGQPSIIKIDRQHEQISDWEPTVLKAAKKGDEEKEDNNKNQIAQYKQNIEVTDLFLPVGPLIKIFSKEGEENQKVEPLTREQYTSQLNQYIKKNLKQEKKMIVLTEDLMNELGIKEHQSDSEDEQKEEQQEEKEKEKEKEKEQKRKQPQNQITLERLQKRIEELMQKSYRIKNLRLNQSELKQGEFKGLQLIAEKQHNQQVNRVVGLEQFGFDHQGKIEDIYSFAYVLKQMQETFHCGVGIHDGTGKNAGKEIILQKNVFDQLPDYCTNILKIDSKYIHEQNKLGTNKKKQEGMTRQ